MKLRTLDTALTAWRTADGTKTRADVLAAHTGVLASSGKPQPWDDFPAARDFFLQWEGGDIRRVLVQGRKW